MQNVCSAELRQIAEDLAHDHTHKASTAKQCTDSAEVFVFVKLMQRHICQQPVSFWVETVHLSFNT